MTNKTRRRGEKTFFYKKKKMFYILPKIDIGETSESNFSPRCSRSSTRRSLPRSQMKVKTSNSYHPITARRSESELKKVDLHSSEVAGVMRSSFSWFSTTFKNFVKNCSIEKIAPATIVLFDNTEKAFSSFIGQISSMISTHVNKEITKESVSATTKRYCSSFSESWAASCNAIIETISKGDPPLFTVFCDLLQNLVDTLYSFRASTIDIVEKSIISESQFNNMVKTIKIIKKTCQRYSLSLEKSDPFLIELGVKTNQIINGVNNYLTYTSAKFSMHSSEYIAKKNQCLMIMAEMTKLIDSILCFSEMSNSVRRSIIETTHCFEQTTALIGLDFVVDIQLHEVPEQEVKEEEKIIMPRKLAEKGSTTRGIKRSMTKSRTMVRKSSVKVTKRPKTSFSAAKTKKADDNELVVVGNSALYL